MSRKIKWLLPIEDEKEKYTEIREKLIEIQNKKELKELKELDEVYLKKKKR